MSKRTALVTGASRGIGRSLALALAKSGYAVAVNFIQRTEEAEKVVQEIKDAGGEADLFPCDIRDSLRVRQMIDAVHRRWGGLNVLINNAGVTHDRTILKMTNAEWEDVINVNLSGAFWCLREATRLMSEAKKGGAVINITSIMGVRGGYGNANYAASKAGLVALTKTAARELGQFNIRVNAVLPGFHETEMATELSDDIKRRVVTEHTLGRTTLSQDLASIVLELCHNESISGQVYSVDSRVL